MKKIKDLKLYKSCLIIVDMVNGFVREGCLHDSNIAHIIPRQIELIKESINRENLIIFIKDTHTKESAEHKRFNDNHCLKGTEESEIVEELQVFLEENNVISIEKNSTSFMEAPDFRKLIEEAENLQHFEICGCCTDICITNGAIGLSNYLDQWNRIYDIYIHEDATETFGKDVREEYVKAAKILMRQQGINIGKKK